MVNADALSEEWSSAASICNVHKCAEMGGQTVKLGNFTSFNNDVSTRKFSTDE